MAFELRTRPDPGRPARRAAHLAIFVKTAVCWDIGMSRVDRAVSIEPPPDARD
ncbi:hypothetical protein BJ969_004086 [Saccharopolyspora gloriosae]|uniref:Uncharacterized protein n=1 Tax=Saccharopolyspora gloriosae TaxID=455344 RepID=A0A840NKZ8_9PSEU|nr:hypothetical protein [Saccharopolyspora gloriosae]MBB5070998.1 hypothetical protein [Saccharopolyspora gloriosae]